MTLIAKLIWLSSFSVLLVLGGAGYFALEQATGKLNQQLSHHLNGNLALSAAKAEELFKHMEEITLTAASNTSVGTALRSQSNANVSQILNDLVSIYPIVNYIAVIQLNGRVLASSNQDTSGNPLRGQNLLQRDLSTHPLFTAADDNISSSAINTDPITAELGLHSELSQWFSSPVKDNDQLVGRVIVSFHTQQAYQQLLDNTLRQLVNTANPIQAISLTNANGDIYAHANIKHQDAIRRHNHSNHLHGEDDLDPWRSVILGVDTLRLSIFSDQQQALRPLKETTQVVGIIIVAAAVVLALLLMIVLRQLLIKRIQVFHQGSQQLSEGQLDYRFPEMGKDELGRLAQAYNHMLEQLQRITTSKSHLDAEMEERKQAQQRLLASNQQLEKTTERANQLATQAQQALSSLSAYQSAIDQHAIVAVTDLSGKIIEVNDLFCQISGYHKTELLGQDHRMLKSGIHPEKFWQTLWSNLNSGQSWSGEICNTNKEGRPFWLATSISPLTDNNHNVISYCAISTNITPLINAQQQAEAASEAKTSFLANMSHEIRTPMNGVLGMTELLLQTELQEEQHRYAQVIQSSAQALLNIINDILDFSKVEAGHLELEQLDFNLQEMLEEFSDLMALKAHEKSLEFICSISPDVPLQLRGDPHRLRQVLINLSGNAIKFTNQGEVSIQVEMVQNTDPACYLKFTVTDTGIGIPDEKLNTLFNAFQQLDASTTRKFGGTGLGLSISKRLTELMGGQINATSTENEGSTFWFTSRFEHAQTRQTLGNADPKKLKGLHVLAVDDNATNRELLASVLSLWQMDYQLAESGEQALQLMQNAINQKHAFDIAILDMQMPEMDGETLASIIKAVPSLQSTPLVMMTSLGLSSDTEHHRKLGFTAYMTKPVKQAQLCRCLVDIIDQLPRELRSRSSQKSSAKANAAATTPARILLVEDNKTNQLVAQGLLKNMSYHVSIANHGQEALQILSQQCFDCILMDCQMPVLDGYRATEAIRANNATVLQPDIPIIAMTAHVMASDRERCLSVGMNDYLAKPIDSALLSQTLRKWIENTEYATASSATKKFEADPAMPETVFDYSSLNRRLAEDHELIQTVLSSFIPDMQQQLSDLSQQLDRADTDSLCNQAHRIKGSAANVGGIALSEAARQLEQALRDDAKPINCEQFIAQLEREFDQLKQQISEVLK